MTWLDIADKVASLLEAPVTAEDGTVTRSYVPEKQLEDLQADEGPTVCVMGRSETQTRIARGETWQHEPEINVAIQKRVASDSECDGLVEFVSELAGVLKLADKNGLYAPLHVSLAGVENRPLYAPGLLREKRVFFSVLVLTFEWWSKPE